MIGQRDQKTVDVRGIEITVHRGGRGRAAALPAQRLGRGDGVERSIRRAGAALRRHRSRPSRLSRQRRSRAHPERRRPRPALRRSAQPSCASGAPTSSARRSAAGSPPSWRACIPSASAAWCWSAPPVCGSRARRSPRCSACCPASSPSGCSTISSTRVAQMLHAAGETAFDTPPPERSSARLSPVDRGDGARRVESVLPQSGARGPPRPHQRADPGALGRRGSAHSARPRRALPRPHPRRRLRTIPQCGHLPAIENAGRVRARGAGVSRKRIRCTRKKQRELPVSWRTRGAALECA